MDCAGNRLQREGGEQGGKFREDGGNVSQRDGEDGCGHEELCERNDGHVGGKADGGGAVKVIRHGEGESHLHYGRDQQQLEGAQAENCRAAHQAQRPRPAEKTREAFRNQAQVHAELRDARRQRWAIVIGVPVSERLAVELRSALYERQADRGDDEHAEKCHLEAGGEELARIEYEQSESGCAERVDHGAVAVKQARAQVDGAHQRGSPHGRAHFGEEGVGDAEENRQQGRGNVGEAQAAKRPENDEGQDGYVHPGDYEDVIGAGALEIDSGVAIDEGLFADDHGVNQRGLRRGPERVHLGNDAGVNAGAPEFEAAADEAGEQLHVFSFRGAQGRDAVRGEVALIVEGSGIAEVARQLQLDGQAEAFAVAEEAHRTGRRLGSL